MRKLTILFVFVLFACVIFSQNRNTLYNNYINQYADLAVKQQQKHKIPASITLAQGLLESGAGQSKLAKTANNHFGIKCHDWKGKKVYHDDDKKNECFRKYDKVLDSYEDHSAFLVNRQRYAFLFDLKPTDYKGWAHGLKKAGYATDPKYAQKLITIIEDYDLHRFDKMAANEKGGNKKAKKEKTPKNQQQTSGGAISIFSTHTVQMTNGLKYVTAFPGDTYKSIAQEYNIKEKKILSYNEVVENIELQGGEKIYLQNKKNKAEKGKNRHTVQEGESFYSISQEYGIKLIDLYKINNFSFDQRAEAGKVIRLRP